MSVNVQDDEMEVILIKAMTIAKDRFFDYLETDMGLEGAYFDIDITGYLCDSNFARTTKVSVENLDLDGKL